MDKVSKFREPLAWVVLVVAVVRMATQLVEVGLDIASGTSIPDALGSAGGSTLTLLMLLFLLLAVVACVVWQPATRFSRTLAMIAAVIVGVAGVLSVIFAFVGLIGFPGGILESILGLLGGLTDATLKFLAMYLLILLRASGTGAKLAAGLIETAEAAGIATSPSDVESKRPVRKEKEPKEPNAGTAWFRAGDAATGAAGQAGADTSGWGRPPQKEQQN